MARAFSAQDLIALPMLSANSTLALMQELQTRASSAKKLPAAVAEALDALKISHDALSMELTRRDANAVADPKKAREADKAIDNAWSALRSWLEGWSELPEDAHPEVESARRASVRLFPNGLSFLVFAFKDEWAESQTRLNTIEIEGFDKLFAKLGGAAFLNTVKKAHKAYGVALGITADKPDNGPNAGIRDVLADSHASLRDYVAQVAATSWKGKPETAKLAEKLLSPLTNWKSSRTPSEKEGNSPEGDGATEGASGGADA